MILSPKNEKRVTIAFGITFILYLLLRVFGSNILENNWSFTHAYYIPIWYYCIPILLSAVFYWVIVKHTDLIENLLEDRFNQILLYGLFLFCFLIFQFDSFVYGGGNYKINQIAQTENLIYRFYELGSTFIVSLFYKLLSLTEIKKNLAGVISWKIFSYIGMTFAFVSSLLLSKKINSSSHNRFLVFIILFLGPQTLSYFGFINQTSLVTGFIYLFLYVGLQLELNKSVKMLGLIWGIAIIAIFTHITMVLLLPALLFVTFRNLFKQKNIAFTLGIISYLLLIIAVFWITSSNFEFAKSILFLENHNMQVRYNLLSLNHIIDYLQLLLLFAPQIIILKFLFFKNIKNIFTLYRFQLALLILISSNTLLFILEPTHSIILDAPMFAVYLSPIVILLAMFLHQSRKHLKYAVLFALIVPLLILPCYTHINTAEKQIENFLEKNHYFYIEGATALQDSYFQRGDFEKANYWFSSLPKKSRDYLDLTAAGEFNYAKMYSESLRLYSQLKAKVPFWGEPRFHIASIQLAQKRFDLARPEIDTCLMIAPYEKEYLKLDYSYYLDIGDFIKAKERVLYTLEIYPIDYNIQTDLAISYYRLKDVTNAETTASAVLTKDSTQAYAYLILGFIAEIKNQPPQAIDFFKQFIKYGAENPETPDIRKRLNNLILQQEK